MSDEKRRPIESALREMAEDDEDEKAMREVAAMSPEEVERELAAKGIDVAKMRARMEQVMDEAARRAEPPAVRRLRPGRAAWALLAAACVASLFFASRLDTREDVPVTAVPVAAGMDAGSGE
jgi:hypothetical protein